MAKSIFSRPLDMLYISFFIVHIVVSVPFNFIPLYPSWIVPNFARAVVQAYIKDSNDSWGLATWDLVARPYEWLWTKVVLYFEAFYFVPVITIGIYTLIKEKHTFYPFLLIYSGMTIVTTTMVTVMYIWVPSTSDSTLSPELAFYAMTDEARNFAIIGSIIFVSIPTIMAIDIANRTVGLIKSGVEAEKGRKNI